MQLDTLQQQQQEGLKVAAALPQCYATAVTAARRLAGRAWVACSCWHCSLLLHGLQLHAQSTSNG
jgi:hypothetical protein